MSPGYMPKLQTEPTETATIPVWQGDGSIRYVTMEDFAWMANNVTDVLPSEDLPSS